MILNDSLGGYVIDRNSEHSGRMDRITDGRFHLRDNYEDSEMLSQE